MDEQVERAPSDLESLEEKSAQTLNSITLVKGRLSNIIDKIRNVDNTSQELVKAEVEPSPKNRLIGVQSIIDKIDIECNTIDGHIESLENILQ